MPGSSTPGGDNLQVSQNLNDLDILAAGLRYARFDTRRQGRVNLNQNMISYKQFFGVDLSTAAPLFADLRNKFSSFKYKDGLMTMNWLFLNNKQSGPSKEYFGPIVKQHATMIQSLKSKKTKFVLGHDQRIKASIDCSNFITNEFCLNQSGKWFDHKINFCGLVCLCFVVNVLFFAIRHSNQLCRITK